MFENNDIGKLLLRFSLGGLILFHGVHKLIYGISSVKSMLNSAGVPEFLAYGIYVGELIVPIFIILGLYARVASVLLSINMFAAIYLAYGFNFSISRFGGLSFETPLLYLVMSLLVFFLGSGRYSVNSK